VIWAHDKPNFGTQSILVLFYYERRNSDVYVTYLRCTHLIEVEQWIITLLTDYDVVKFYAWMDFTTHFGAHLFRSQAGWECFAASMKLTGHCSSDMWHYRDYHLSLTTDGKDMHWRFYWTWNLVTFWNFINFFWVICQESASFIIIYSC